MPAPRTDQGFQGILTRLTLNLVRKSLQLLELKLDHRKTAQYVSIKVHVMRMIVYT